MNYERIRFETKDDRYITYLQKLENEKEQINGSWVQKNKWFSYLTDQKLIDIYKEVSLNGLSIDGDTVCLQYIGGAVKPSYNFQAYKNLVIKRYPETIFDFQIVYQGDSFTFSKDSGKVTYSHIFGDPFATKKVIIGAYGVIKNSSGEFIEIINKEEIDKFKNSAKTKNIWNTWESEMVKKSIIKRICKVNFKDLTHSIEDADNDNYSPELAEVPSAVQEECQNITNVEDLTPFFNKYSVNCKYYNELVSLCAQRKKEINGNS